MFGYHNPYILLLRCHLKMTPKEKPSEAKQMIQTLEEICENTRAIRRVVNRILDHLHESAEQDLDYEPDGLNWEYLNDNDDMYY